MGLFDISADDPFERMFDWNGDGRLDFDERIRLADYLDDEEIDGLTLDEIEDMDEDERREFLENAGLDPDDLDI